MIGGTLWKLLSEVHHAKNILVPRAFGTRMPEKSLILRLSPHDQAKFTETGAVQSRLSNLIQSNQIQTGDKGRNGLLEHKTGYVNII